jgi:hypothetical protein
MRFAECDAFTKEATGVGQPAWYAAADNLSTIEREHGRRMVRFLFFLLALSGVSSIHAEPLVHFALEGRKFGTEDPFSANLPVALGDVVEYRLRAVVSPPVTPYELIRKNSLGTMLHGINSLFVEISQDAGDGIQIDFDSLPQLSPGAYPGFGWGAGTGAQSGILRPRPGTVFNDLIDIRAIHGPGIFTAHEWETVATGSFEVASMSGASAEIRGQWSTGTEAWRPGIGDDRSGGFAWDGEIYFITSKRESGPDPRTDYVPLTLTAAHVNAVPEPSTLVLLGTITGVLVMVRQVRRKLRSLTPPAARLDE